MRGKEVQGLLQDLVGGITPVYAGKSHTCSIGFPALQDHPRVCGEKCSVKFFVNMLLGSPPRVRGKVSTDGLYPTFARITPAYAGKRWGRCADTGASRDHPCVCGEKFGLPSATLYALGSPPRMRGKGPAGQILVVSVGITPACAGKSRSQPRLPCTGRDHPRACGEKRFASASLDAYWGSPPRMRGKGNFHVVTHTKVGITPAHAGKSSIQHLTASLGEFEVQKGHPVFHLRQRLQVWPDHARHLRHGLILHASRSAGQGRRLCPGPCPDTAGSGTPRGPSPAKRPHTSPPAATPGGCRAWQSGATAPGSR